MKSCARLELYFAPFYEKFTQIGSSTDVPLLNVIDMRGTNLEVSCGIIRGSRFIITATGGLTHLAAALEKKAFVVQTNGEPLALGHYSCHRYVNAAGSCDICSRNLRDPMHESCPHAFDCIRSLSESVVNDALEKHLDYLLSDSYYNKDRFQSIANSANGLEDFYLQKRLLKSPDSLFF